MAPFTATSDDTFLITVGGGGKGYQSGCATDNGFNGGGGAGSSDYCCSHGGGGGGVTGNNGSFADAASIPLDYKDTGIVRSEYNSHYHEHDTRDSTGLPAHHDIQIMVLHRMQDTMF